MQPPKIADTSSAIETVQRSHHSNFEKILTRNHPDHYYKKSDLLKLLETYSIDELASIYDDYHEIRTNCFSALPKKEKVYIATAGGPASGKSTLLEKEIGYNEMSGKNDKGFAYIDPDRTCMQKMQRTYLQDRKKGIEAEKAYTKWRDASNFISNCLLAEALHKGYPIAHGTTLATPPALGCESLIRSFYGYKTTILHLTTAEPIRRLLEKMRRDKGMVQCTPKDFEEKQLFFVKSLPGYAKLPNVIFHLMEKTASGDFQTVKIAECVDIKIEIISKIALKKFTQVIDNLAGKEGYAENSLFSKIT